MDKDDLLLTDEEIEAIPVTNLGGNADDLNVAQDELKKVVGAMSKNGWWNNGQSCYCISKEFYMRLKKIAGIK